jgi:hypothetical protein
MPSWLLLLVYLQWIGASIAFIRPILEVAVPIALRIHGDIEKKP